MFGFTWLISSHWVIPAVNIRRHRCILKWRVYPTMFLNHANLSNPGSLWAPLLRVKFGRIIILRKHSGNDLSPFFYLLSIIFFVASDLFFFHFFFQTHTYTHTLSPPFSPINILDISYVFIYVHVYLHHTILHDDDEHPTFPYFILIIVSHGHLLFFCL